MAAGGGDTAVVSPMAVGLGQGLGALTAERGQGEVVARARRTSRVPFSASHAQDSTTRLLLRSFSLKAQGEGTRRESLAAEGPSSFYPLLLSLFSFALSHLPSPFFPSPVLWPTLPKRPADGAVAWSPIVTPG